MTRAVELSTRKDRSISLAGTTSEDGVPADGEGGANILTDFFTVKLLVGIDPTDTSQDLKIQFLAQGADAAVKQYCKRQLETGIYTHYPRDVRLGGEAMIMAEAPIRAFILSGNIVEGEATITGISSTGSLAVGMTAITIGGAPGSSQITQPFPNAATIQSVDSSSQVTMTGNASYSSANQQLLFGCSLWFDPNGSFGAGPGTDPTGPYGSTTLLYPGIDYTLQLDPPDNLARAGKLIRLASAFGFLGMGGAWNPYGSSWGGLNARGTLTAPLKPLWPNWPPGSFRLMYCAGYGYGATPPAGMMPVSTTIPADLSAATAMLAAWMFRNADTGGVQYQSESFQGYSGNVAQFVDPLKSDDALGSVRQMLSRYRKLAIG